MADVSTPTFVATAAVAAALGPVLGQYALIAFGAVAGSMLAMGKQPMATRMEAVKFVAVGVVVALAITGFFAYLVETYTPVPAHIALMPIALVIGASRNAILALMERVIGALGTFAEGFGNRKGGGQ